MNRGFDNNLLLVEPSQKTFELLLVEDNPGDVRLTREALKESHIQVRVSVAKDGAEALSYLYREGKHARAARPDLIFLDLNLPGTDGFQLLSEIKKSPEFGRIPVIVVTTSDSERDVKKSYGLHANCYLTKKVDLEEFTDSISKTAKFWFGIAKLPAP